MHCHIRNRHWFIVRKPGDAEILCLFSAFSVGHIRRADVLDDKPYLIEKAKRWQVSFVFSGLPFFYDYKTTYGTEDVNSLVPNEFMVQNDDSVVQVMVIG